MSIGIVLALVGSAFVSATVSGMIGMAGGALLLGVMTLFMPLSMIIPIHGAVQFTSNISRTLLLYKHVKLRVFAYFVLGIPAGGYLGFLLLRRISHQEWMLVLVSALLLYIAFKPKKLPYIYLPVPCFLILSVVASCAGLLVGATGPMLAPFFIRDDFKKEEIVATKAACQLFIHTVKFPVFYALHFQYNDHIILILLMCSAVISGTYLGTSLLKKSSSLVFFTIVKLACAGLAGRLLFKLIE